MSRTELTQLNVEQRARLPDHARRWAAVPLATKPVDRPAAQACVSLAYRTAGLPPPERFEWTKGPVSMAREIRRSDLRWPIDRSVREAIADTPQLKVGAIVDAAVARSVRAELWRELPALASSTTCRAVNDAVLAAVAAEGALQPEGLALRLRFWHRTGMIERRRRLFASLCINPFAPGPLALYQFLHDVCGLTEATQPLAGLWSAVSRAGWIAPFDRVCWMSERPSVLRTDPAGRLHAGDGPALAFADGWCQYFWKGIPVPAWMIERRAEITAASVDREHDVVLRRCLIEIMTPAAYIAQSDAVAVAEDDAGILWVKSWTDWDRWAAVEVVNGSPEPDGTYKHYVLQVPPTLSTPREAVAWTYGLSERDYLGLRHRT